LLHVFSALDGTTTTGRSTPLVKGTETCSEASRAGDSRNPTRLTRRRWHRASAGRHRLGDCA
jgi:hypothetical protein